MIITLSPSDSDFLPSEILCQSIADDLRVKGYAIVPNALPNVVVDGLLESMAESESEFTAASIGRGKHQLKNEFVRRDEICWLTESMPAASTWLQWTGALQASLNRQLLLGLFSFESHLAHYPPGAFYKKHVDAFRGDSNRVLSMVAYLNKGWLPDQGGELVLYDEHNNQQELLRVQPVLGTVVIFLSEVFPHEVLPADRDRYSVAGWFRVNTSINGVVDPPS